MQGSGIACIGKAWEWNESEKIEVDHCFCGLIENSNPAILHAGRELCLDESLKQDYGFRVRDWSLYVSNMRILRDKMLRSNASYAGLYSPMPLSHTYFSLFQIDAAHKYVAAAHNALFVLLLKLMWSKHISWDHYLMSQIFHCFLHFVP